MHERRVILPKDGDWNDSLYACFLDEDGHKCSLELRASLDHASDEDKTGKWQLVDGGYKFNLEKDGDKPVLRPDGNVKAWFDEHGQGALRPGDLLPADHVPGTPPPAAKEEALSLIPRALRAEGASARTYYVAGVLYRSKDPAGAADAFRRALEIEPSHADASLELRLLEMRQGKSTPKGTGVLSGIFGKRKP